MDTWKPSTPVKNSTSPKIVYTPILASPGPKNGLLNTLPHYSSVAVVRINQERPEKVPNDN